jgi:predicted nucleic acid-binding protein
MFILDTNVVSELRKTGNGKADPNVVSWLEQQDAASFYLSAITVMELELGVQQIERKDSKQGGILRTWLETRVLTEFSGRVLPVDESVALCCAGLHVPDPRSERDALIAATALVHGMAVVTRNLVDFEATDVSVVNPWVL